MCVCVSLFKSYSSIHCVCVLLSSSGLRNTLRVCPPLLLWTPAGRTLQDGSQTVGEVGMKEGSKLMLLGRKVRWDHYELMDSIDSLLPLGLRVCHCE